MPSTRNVVFLALTAGIGVLAFLLVGMDPGRPALAGEGEVVDVGRTTAIGPAPGAVEVEPGPELVDLTSREGAGVGGGRSTTVIYPLEVEFSLALDRTLEIPDGAEPIKSGAIARLEGSFRGGSGKPLPVTVTFLHGPNEGRVLRGDADGRFGAGDLWQGLSVVKLEAPSGLAAVREVRLVQRATAQVHVSFAGASYVTGTVTDDRGAALEGAEVSLDGRVAYTDDEGYFSFPRVAPGAIFATVRKEGFAIGRRKVALAHGRTLSPEDFVIRMQPASTLELLIDRRAGDEGPTTAVLMPATAGARSGEAFPWYEVNPVTIPASGRVSVPGLPPEAVLIKAFRRGAVQSSRSVQARLQRGRATLQKIDFDPAPLVRGVVLDGGKPASGVAVTIEASNQTVAGAYGLGVKNPRFNIDLVTPPVPTAFDRTVTDAKGRFRFTRDPGLVTTYYVSAQREMKNAAVVVPAGSETFVLNLEDAGDGAGSAEIELPGRYQGLPVDVSVQGHPRDRQVLPGGEALIVEDLGPGAWVVRARWRGKEVVARQVVEVEPGERVEIEGSLPRPAIEGQTPEERRIHEMRTRGR